MSLVDVTLGEAQFLVVRESWRKSLFLIKAEFSRIFLLRLFGLLYLHHLR